MDCGMKFVKFLLFAFNLIFFIIALILIAVGAAVEIKYRDLTMITGSTISAAPILLICIGAFILIVAFFGCCGAYKENYCMVTSFMVLLVIIFILEFAAGIAALALKGKIEGWITVSVQKAIRNYKPENSEVFDVIQTKFKCCGGVSEKDWRNSTGFQTNATSTIQSANLTKAAEVVPDSCCVTEVKHCGLEKGHHIYNGTANGCIEKVEDYIKKNAVMIGGVGIGIAFIQLVGIFFACCLMRAIKKQYEVV